MPEDLESTLRKSLDQIDRENERMKRTAIILVVTVVAGQIALAYLYLKRRHQSRPALLGRAPCPRGGGGRAQHLDDGDQLHPEGPEGDRIVVQAVI